VSYLRYLCLFAHSDVQHVSYYIFVLFFFVLCTLCCQFLYIVHLVLPLSVFPNAFFEYLANILLLYFDLYISFLVDFHVIVLLTGCFCIGPGIDSRLAVLAPRPVGPKANTADRESIPGPIQKQPVRNTFIK
jgi:hypothetical protein